MVNDTEIIHDLWPLCGIVIRDRLCWCVQSNYNLVQTADGWFKASHHGKGWWQAAKQPLPSRLRWKLTGQNLFLSFLFSIVLGELVTIKYYEWLTMTITYIHTYSWFNFGTPPLVFPLHGRAPWLMPWPWWQLVLVPWLLHSQLPWTQEANPRLAGQGSSGSHSQAATDEGRTCQATSFSCS